VNSVFTSRSVELLSDSILFHLLQGVQKVHYSLSYMQAWDEPAIRIFERELQKLNELSVEYYKEKGKIPILNYTKASKNCISSCPAGQDRLVITSTGEIWGCPLFPDHFTRWAESDLRELYCFGSVKENKINLHEIFPRISANYAQLRMDNYSTSKMECFLCNMIEYCAVCPITSSFIRFELVKIPEFICNIQRIKIQKMLEFYNEINSY